MTWRGVFSGALALIALQVVVSRQDAAGKVGSGASWIATLVTAALDPSRPAIPDLSPGGVFRTSPDFLDQYRDQQDSPGYTGSSRPPTGKPPSIGRGAVPYGSAATTP